jgi:hypothetical protein
MVAVSPIITLTAAEYIKMYFDWLTLRPPGRPGEEFPASVKCMITESRPSLFGWPVALPSSRTDYAQQPHVAITVGDLYVVGRHLVGENCRRQTFDSSQTMVGSDNVQVTLDPDVGSGTLNVPSETKSFQLVHCVLIGATDSSIPEELASTAKGEVITVMLWADEGAVLT